MLSNYAGTFTRMYGHFSDIERLMSSIDADKRKQKIVEFYLSEDERNGFLS
jgi:hypothetical protein